MRSVITVMLLLLSIVQIGHAAIYEAEDAVVVGPNIKSTNSGYTGTGYADYANASDDYVEWTVDVASGGDYDLLFRYALSDAAGRPLEIQVNGNVVASSLGFPDTGGWSTWGMTAPLSVTLDAGANTVRATAIGSSGGNVDHLQVIDPTLPTGYDLWLRYSAISDAGLLAQYRLDATEIVVQGSSDTLTAITDELNAGLDGLLDQDVPTSGSVTQDGAVVAGTPASSSIIASLGWDAELTALGAEGYLIRSAVVSGKNVTVIASDGEVGALYGSFAFLRLIQTNQSLSSLDISESPKIKQRMLNHWDWDKDGNITLVERGYAGNSIWKWDDLPGIVDPRYTDYARANASIGINGTVVNNVNAQVEILTPEYLAKVAALADVFRPYGIKVYLTARYDAPEALSSLTTSDPTIPAVRAWWDAKVAEIYTLIPDFGGFLIKADSEGNPGPNTYGLNHAEGANPLADALAAHGGMLFWRAFVYDSTIDADRVKRAYKQFMPLDGDYNSNVFVQAKNGPLDFQPREPFHPLFGGMSQTPVNMEFQITQEYLGHSTHLVYLAPMWKEVLDSDTYANGAGSTVAKVIDGTVHGHSMSAIAGVANIGSDTNWCGHHFAQANWYAYGRLAWDYDLTSEGIADEWIQMTWSNDPEVRTKLASMMMPSWEAAINYMTPLGLAFTVDSSNYDPSHYYANPPIRNNKYWFADSDGLGYDRTAATGTDATGQYFSPVSDTWESLATCPEDYLLWFHKVDWDHTLNSGRTLWDELCFKYYDGVQHVTDMIAIWNSLSAKIDAQRFSDVQSKLNTHETDATDFRNTYITYFQGLNGNLPVPPYNQAPSFTSDPINKPNATEDKAYSGTLADVADDPESDPMTFSKEGGPDWLVVDPNGTLSGTPTDSDTNDVPNVFTVKVDATGGSDTAILTIEVLNTYSGVRGMEDLTGFAAQWLSSGCIDTPPCGGADLDDDTDVTLSDLAVFAGNWLAGTSP
ncbi:MAG: alpha-glucuronidase family glycosyl hydrolase [Planctomycetota bacterium]